MFSQQGCSSAMHSVSNVCGRLRDDGGETWKGLGCVRTLPGQHDRPRVKVLCLWEP
jgi:hypothetical protein